MDPLQYKPVVKVAGTDYSGQIETLSYTDEADGSSDSLSITLSDISGKWHGSKMPKKAVVVLAKIKRTGGDVANKIFNCGRFHLDEMEFQGYPSIATFGAVSDPVSYAFKTTKRTKIWKNSSFKQVAADIAKKYKSLSIVYDGPAIPLVTIEQSKQTDSSFLKSLAEKYGFGMKIYSNKIVLYSIEKYEKKNPVRTIKMTQMEPGWSYTTTINGNYTGVKLSYKSSGGKTITTQHGSSKRLLILSEKADNKADAERIALARVNKENMDTTKLRFTLRTPAFLTATSCIQITGMGKINGKYFITRVRHTLSNGYKVQVECRKITKRIS